MSQFTPTSLGVCARTCRKPGTNVSLYRICGTRRNTACPSRRKVIFSPMAFTHRLSTLSRDNLIGQRFGSSHDMRLCLAEIHQHQALASAVERRRRAYHDCQRPRFGDRPSTRPSVRQTSLGRPWSLRKDPGLLFESSSVAFVAMLSPLSIPQPAQAAPLSTASCRVENPESVRFLTTRASPWQCRSASLISSMSNVMSRSNFAESSLAIPSSLWA